MRLAPVTVQTSLQIVKRFLTNANDVVSYETIKNYLATYIDKAPKTYNSQITNLRRFVRDYLRLKELVESFKLAPVDEIGKPINLPTKEQLRKGFEGLSDDRARAIFLFTATCGLRKCEILALEKKNIDPKLRSVVANHYTRKKRSGITFYSDEAEIWLSKYWRKRNDNDSKAFEISDRKWRQIWHNATEAANIKITPQVLRVWFATEMGERLDPDRYIDIFQGRAPRSELAKHYTGKEFERLRRIYDNAHLKVLG